MSVNIFDSCTSTKCCHSLNWGWIETVTDFPRCVIFIAEGTLSLIPLGVFLLNPAGPLPLIPFSMFMQLYTYAAAECSWMKRWRTYQVFLTPASGPLGKKSLKVRDLNVHYIGFWEKILLLHLQNCKWRRQRQPVQHWGNVYINIYDRAQPSDCEPAVRAQTDLGENWCPEQTDSLRVGPLVFTLAKGSLCRTVLTSQYPTDYNNLLGNKSLKWLAWHKAVSFYCIFAFSCGEICALVC